MCGHRGGYIRNEDDGEYVERRRMPKAARASISQLRADKKKAEDNYLVSSVELGAQLNAAPFWSSLPPFLLLISICTLCMDTIGVSIVVF